MHIRTLGGGPLGFVSTLGAGVVEFADRCGVFGSGWVAFLGSHVIVTKTGSCGYVVEVFG